MKTKTIFYLIGSILLLSIVGAGTQYKFTLDLDDKQSSIIEKRKVELNMTDNEWLINALKNSNELDSFKVYRNELSGIMRKIYKNETLMEKAITVLKPIVD